MSKHERENIKTKPPARKRRERARTNSIFKYLRLLTRFRGKSSPFLCIGIHSGKPRTPLDDRVVAQKLFALHVIYEALFAFCHCCGGRVGHDRKRCNALPGEATACFIYSRGQDTLGKKRSRIPAHPW